MTQNWCRLAALCVAGTMILPMLGRANTAPVALDDSYTTLQGQAIEVGSDLMGSNFDMDSDGFTLVKDPLGTNNPNFVQGSWGRTRGQAGGGLYVKTGPTNRTGTPIGETSATWNKSFVLKARTAISIQLNFRLTMASGYETNEFASAILGINSTLLGNGPSSTLTTHFGNPGEAYDSGWLRGIFQMELDAGTHTLWAGVYSNNSTATNEYAEVFLDNLLVEPTTQVGVLQNDTDIDGDRMFASITQQPANGLLVFKNNGSFTYTPNPGFAGTETFKYKAFDGKTNSNAATVTIVVDSKPNAGADVYSVDEDSPLITTKATGVLHNDNDPDGSPLTATLVNGTSNGGLNWNPDGQLPLPARAQLPWRGRLQLQGFRREADIRHRDRQDHRPTGERSATDHA